jgi:hypothetical protein
MKIFFIKLNFYNIHIKFKIVFKKSSGAFWYFNEASPIPGTHFWKDFAFGKGKNERNKFTCFIKKKTIFAKLFRR